MRRVLPILLLSLAAHPIAACSIAQFDPDEMLQNQTYASSNGRYVAVHRWYERLTDFRSARAGDVTNDWTLSPDRTVALYEVAPHGRRLLRTFAVPIADAGAFLVSDDGVSVIAVRNLVRACGGAPDPDAPLVTIFAGGERIAGFHVRDVLSPYDLRFIDSATFALRRDDTRDVVVVTLPAPDHKFVERRIDLATATLLDAPKPLYPTPHVLITAESSSHELQPATSKCASAWNDVERVEPQTLYDRARSKPLPAFPDLLQKANLRGDVLVDVVVSEEGRVLCTRASRFPFGGSEAAVSAIRAWTFEPRAAKYAGTLLVTFKDSPEE